MKAFITILIVSLLFTGCIKKDLTTGYINDCYCKNKNFSLHIPTNKCNCKRSIKIKKHKDEGCETEITQIYNSKASGRIKTCKGKLLEDGQKTRTVYVTK